MALRVRPHEVVRGVDKLLADADVPLEDKYSGVVDGLCIVHLQDLCLEAAFQETLRAEAQHIIKLLLVLSENSKANQSADKGITLEHALRVLLLEGQKLTCGRSNLCKCQLCAPNFALAAQAILAQQLQRGTAATS